MPLECLLSQPIIQEALNFTILNLWAKQIKLDFLVGLKAFKHIGQEVAHNGLN